MARRSYSGNAVPTQLVGGISDVAMSFIVADATGHPDGTNGPWVETLGRDSSAEEAILCLSRAGTTFTVSQRGYDGTLAVPHVNTTSVEHTDSKTDADEANAHINDLTRDDHTQYSLFKRTLLAARGAASRIGKLHYGIDTGYLSVDDGSTWHDFQDKAASDAAYAPITGLPFVGVQASRTTAQSIPNSTLTAITWPTETFDTHAFHDLVTNPSRLTVPAGKAGYYRVSALVDWANTVGGTTRSIQITVNGISIASTYLTPGSNDVTNTVDVITHLSVGDYVAVFGYQDSGVAVNVGALGTTQPCLVSLHFLGT